MLGVNVMQSLDETRMTLIDTGQHLRRINNVQCGFRHRTGQRVAAVSRAVGADRHD